MDTKHVIGSELITNTCNIITELLDYIDTLERTLKRELDEKNTPAEEDLKKEAEFSIEQMINVLNESAKWSHTNRMRAADYLITKLTPKLRSGTITPRNTVLVIGDLREILFTPERLMGGLRGKELDRYHPSAPLAPSEDPDPLDRNTLTLIAMYLSAYRNEIGQEVDEGLRDNDEGESDSVARELGELEDKIHASIKRGSDNVLH